ncbi:hypothetical protein M8J76_001095 [Diaphorina citri]|nr:hypothetical protein M8J76_011646 [Diaphorina citri]KAI5748668.1 hypothetical protein M8J76_001095 [Diaphorina citri]
MSVNSGGDPPQNLVVNLYQDGVAYEQFKVVFECKPLSNPVPNDVNASSNPDDPPQPKSPYLGRYKVGQCVTSIIPHCDVLDYTRVSRTKVIVQVKSLQSANKLVTELATHNLYKVYIPATYLYKYAILRDVDVDFTNEEILDNIDGKNFKIVEIYRLNRRVNVENSVKYVPSNTIKLRIAGQSIPSYVYLFHVRGELEAYMQPVIQCFKCLQYGHTSSKCTRNDAKCRDCSSTLSNEEHQCTSAKKCLHCQGGHSATSKNLCPEFSRQSKIKKLMLAQPLCFQEAAILCPKNNSKSFSSHVKKSLTEFPALTPMNDLPSTIPALVIPLSSSPLDSEPATPSSSFASFKRRVPAPSAKPRKRVQDSRKSELFDFNSPLMKKQLFSYDQSSGANGVCLNPNPKPINPSPVITPDTPHPADHSYAQVANKFKLPTLHFSQSQSSDFNMDTAYDQNVHATSSLSTSAEVNAMNH